MNILRFLKSFNSNRWDLAFFEEAKLQSVVDGDYSSVHWMKYKDRSRWFADPFILSVENDTITVLVEELSYSLNKGRIAKLVVDRNTWELIEMKIILELPTHLSFPMIFRQKDNIIIIPENSASGKSVAYLYNPLDDSMTPHGIVCDDPITDATILKVENKYYMLATAVPEPNGNEMLVYSFDPDSLKASKIKTVSFDRPIARNAGSPFNHRGTIYRPAQDCDGAYGKGVVLQKVNYNNSTGDLIFTDEGLIYPFSFNYHLGLHTLNTHDGMCVIDGRGLLFPILGRIVRPLISIFH